MSSDGSLEARGGAAGASSGSDGSRTFESRDCNGDFTGDTHPSDSSAKGQKSDRNLQLQIQAALHNKIQELEVAVEEAEAEKKEAAKRRKKQVREVQKVMASKDSTQDKLEQLHKKFLEQVNDRGQLEQELCGLHKDLERTTREKENLQQDLKRVTLLKDKLEDLCRTLQKENKNVLEEVRQKAEAESQHRKELSERFQSTLQDVSAKLERQGEQAEKSLTENVELKEKLHMLLEMLKTKDLQLKVLEAELTEAKTLVEKEHGRANATEERYKIMAEAKDMLESAVADHTKKLDELTKLFSELKSDLDSSESLKLKLQKDNEEMKRKCNKADVTIVKLLDERTTLKKQVEKLEVKVLTSVDQSVHNKLKAQKEKLESLCRALHKEQQASREEAAAVSEQRGDEDANGTEEK